MQFGLWVEPGDGERGFRCDPHQPTGSAEPILGLTRWTGVTSRCDLVNPDAFAYMLRSSRCSALRERDLVPEVGPEPRPHRNGATAPLCPRPDSPPAADRRSETRASRSGDRVVSLGGARVWTSSSSTESGLGLHATRRPWAADHPAGPRAHYTAGTRGACGPDRVAHDGRAFTVVPGDYPPCSGRFVRVRIGRAPRRFLLRASMSSRLA
jgi:hypothetical protein